MEGPTPVSALIHAATMVTAGVYLLVRASPIFEAAPDVQHLAAILGMLTLLLAGLVALVQWDIKRFSDSCGRSRLSAGRAKGSGEAYPHARASQADPSDDGIATTGCTWYAGDATHWQSAQLAPNAYTT